MRAILACLFVFVSAACFSPAAIAGPGPDPEPALPPDLPVGTSNLLSLYTFDNTADNSVAAAPDGTLQGEAHYVTGRIGNAVSLDGIDDYVNLTTAAFPNAAGVRAGSISFWINTDTYANGKTIIGAFNDGSNTAFKLVANRNSQDQYNIGSLFFSVSGDGGSDTFSSGLSIAKNSWRNGAWSQVVVTWDLFSESYGKGYSHFYIDGDSVSNTTALNSIDNDTQFSSWQNPMRAGAGGRDIPDDCFSGSLDDMGIWNDRLGKIEVKALYSLASDSTLNYNSADAALLFDTFAGGPGTENITSDGKRWVYSSDITGTPGTVINHSGVVLGNGGVGGVQLVPEPCSVILLAAGLIGLTAYAWRKRKLRSMQSCSIQS